MAANADFIVSVKSDQKSARDADELDDAGGRTSRANSSPATDKPDCAGGDLHGPRRCKRRAFFGGCRREAWPIARGGAAPLRAERWTGSQNKTYSKKRAHRKMHPKNHLAPDPPQSEKIQPKNEEQMERSTGQTVPQDKQSILHDQRALKGSGKNPTGEWGEW